MSALSIAMNDDELAAELGVSRMTIWRMRKADELPPTIPTKRRSVRTRRADFDQWLAWGCPSTDEFIALQKTKQRLGAR